VTPITIRWNQSSARSGENPLAEGIECCFDVGSKGSSFLRKLTGSRRVDGICHVFLLSGRRSANLLARAFRVPSRLIASSYSETRASSFFALPSAAMSDVFYPKLPSPIDPDRRE
jgi:hypothetical protein